MTGTTEAGGAGPLAGIRVLDLSAYLAEPSHLASAFRRLRYAGFSAANSIRVLKRFSQQADELDGSEE